MVLEKDVAPERVRYPGCEGAGDQQAADDVTPDRSPIHHEVAGGGRQAPRARQPPQQRTRLLDAHVHRGVRLHRALDAALGLSARRFEHAGTQQAAEQHAGEDDDQRAAHELCKRELPAQNDRHDDAELDDEVRGGDLEGDRGDEVRALAEERAGQRDRRIRAGGGRGAECRGDRERAGRRVR
jgi:hypothetical protein